MLKILTKNKDKLFQTNEFSDWVIKPNSRCINLNYAIDLILDFNEEFNYKNEDNKNEDNKNANKGNEKLREKNENEKLRKKMKMKKKKMKN